MSDSAIFHTLVTGDDDAPGKWMIFAHGIFGTGANWRTFARRWLAERDGWGAVLVDLREHGKSQGLPPPHTIAAAARDLDTLTVPSGTIRGVAGHSFGGKVALEYVASRSGDLDEAWILDSTPSARPDARGSEDTERVFSILASLPKTFEARTEFTEALRSEGLSPGIVEWLAMNVVRNEDDGGASFRFRLDLAAVGLLLDDYFARDLWPVVEEPPGDVNLHFVIGERSKVVDTADRERLDRAAARHPTRISVVELPGAGHWVHVDAPDELFRVMTSV